MTLIATLLLIALLVLAFASCAWWIFIRIPKLVVDGDESAVELRTKLDTWFSELEKRRRFNGTISLALGDQVILVKGYGVQDHERRERLDGSSLVRLASVSKQFTAAAVLVLVERGQLDLNESLACYLPDFPDASTTILQLLSHTSGINFEYTELIDPNDTEGRAVDNDLVLSVAVSRIQRKPLADAGLYRYCNTNYALLALLIERVSGQSFAEYLTSNLFVPLGLRNTQVWRTEGQDGNNPKLARGLNIYEPRPGYRPVRPTGFDSIVGDGAIHSSAADMLQWSKFWTHGGGLISKESLDAALDFSGPNIQYAVGWIKVGGYIWHNGQWLSSQVHFVRSMSGDSVLFLADVGGSFSYPLILREILRALDINAPRLQSRVAANS